MTGLHSDKESSWPWADRHPRLGCLVSGVVLLAIMTVIVLVVVGVLTSNHGGCGFDLAGTCGGNS